MKSNNKNEEINPKKPYSFNLENVFDIALVKVSWNGCFIVLSSINHYGMPVTSHYFVKISGSRSECRGVGICLSEKHFCTKLK